jgi:hypothetical protein
MKHIVRMLRVLNDIGILLFKEHILEHFVSAHPEIFVKLKCLKKRNLKFS